MQYFQLFHAGGKALLNHPTVGLMRVTSNTTVFGLFLLVLALVFTGGCAGSSGNSRASSEPVRPERLRYDNLDLSSFEMRGYDINEDGNDDVFRFFEGGVLRVERFDLNFDGRVDMTAYYDRSGQLVEEEFQLDYDELVDTVRHYESGVLAEKQVSIDFDGRFPLVKFYDTKGELLRIERDSNQDGNVDVWEYYSEGRLVRVGRDADGDGTPEVVNYIR